MNDDEISEATALLEVMANSRRLAVLDVLHHEGEMSVNALAGRVGLSQSALSQHLGILRATGMVDTRRNAQTIFYRAKSESVLRILDTLEALFGEPAERSSGSRS